jgi:hypothetical protein
MKRLLLIFCIAVLALSAPLPARAWELEQQWTKPVATGVAFYHFRLRFEQGPVHLYMLEIQPDSRYTIRPVVANNRIGSLAPVEQLAKGVGAVAAINGGFFDTGRTRLPVGLIKIDYQTLFEQFLHRPVLGIDAQGGVHFATFELHSCLFAPETSVMLPLFGYNRARKYGEIIAYTPEFGPMTRTNEWGREFVLKRVSPQAVPGGGSNYLGEKYIILGEEAGNAAIPRDGMMVSFHSNALSRYGKMLAGLYPGAEVEVLTDLPEGWASFPHLLGGGPMLLSGGSYVLNYREEKFKSAMNSPTARTAVGKTRDGRTVLVVIDAGAKDYSVGATWHQLAVVSRDFLNVEDLMGFDGGGSSTMYVGDRVANRPKDGAARSVANIIAIVKRG